MEKEVNGWKYYRSPIHGKMVAYHRVAGEQLTFETDEGFEKWLETEKSQ